MKDMKKLFRKEWNRRLKRIAAIEGVRKLPKLPKSLGYTKMFKQGLSPVQAVAKIVGVGPKTSVNEIKLMTAFLKGTSKRLDPFSLFPKGNLKSRKFGATLHEKHSKLAMGEVNWVSTKFEKIVIEEGEKAYGVTPTFVKTKGDILIAFDNKNVIKAAKGDMTYDEYWSKKLGVTVKELRATRKKNFS